MSTTFRLQIPTFDLPYGAVGDLCVKYSVQELALFGSILRADFRPDSDIDFLVVFRDNDLGPWMGKLQDFEHDLSQILGRKADVVLKASVEQSDNYIRRSEILRNAAVIYAA
jgi:predicted nucleotidyltransferase